MAKIGLSGAYIAPHAEGKIGTFASLGNMIKYDGSPKWSERELYGNNTLIQSKSVFTKSDITFEVDDISINTLQTVFNATENQETNEITFNDNDKTVYMTAGIIGKIETTDGATKYRAIILPKITLTPPNDAYQTEGESVTYQTATLSGKWFKADNGDWKKEKICDTLDAAVAYIKTFEGADTSTLAKTV